MAISIIQAMQWGKPIGGAFGPPLLAYNEANTQSFKVGAVLAISSGTIVEATAASPTTGIAGIACQPGQNLASAPSYPAYGDVYPAGLSTTRATSLAGTAEAVTPLLMVAALQGVVFEGTFANGGNDQAINVTDVWTKYGLTKDATSGFWYVDKAKTAGSGSVTIIGVKNPQDLTFGTTVGARVYFVFNLAETIYA